MLKYLIIQLADDSVSFCHWHQRADSHKLMPLAFLKKAIVYAMKENLTVQFVYPIHQLPQEYYDIIEEVDHVNIKPLQLSSDGDMAVCSIDDVIEPASFNGIITIHTTIKSLIEKEEIIVKYMRLFERINIIVDNISDFNDSCIEDYSDCLMRLSDVIIDEISKGQYPQVNLLTDRIALKSMNNCNVGIDSISVCPDGNFYICPGFYTEGLGALGNVNSPVSIKNRCLYTLKYAPICAHCDAFQCKRCIKLNKQLTHEVNTPSRQQCIMAHIERNTSARLLSVLQHKFGIYKNVEIITDNCLDPFEKRSEWEE